MSENNEEKLNTDEVVIKKSGILSKLDNFWYHYKWHSLIALFLVFTVTICTLQMCDKEDYDAYILYAGGYALGRDSQNTDKPEYTKMKDSIEYFVEDYDENGNVNISFRDLFVPTDEDLKDLEETYYRRAYEDKNTLSSTMMAGDYFLCFFSTEVYENYKSVSKENEPGIFADLSYIVPTGCDVEYYDESNTAVLLSSTEFYGLPGVSSLPADTLICIRNTTFSTHLNQKENKREFERAKEIFVEIIKYAEK